MRLTKAFVTLSLFLSQIPRKQRLNWIATRGQASARASALIGALALASCQPGLSPNDSALDDVSTEISADNTQTPTTATSSSPAIKAPPPPPPNSYLAQLPPNATNQLVKLDIDIVIPTYLTPNMTLVDYEVGEKTDGAYYWLIYQDTQNRCFAIEYSSKDISDSSLENQESLNSGLFDDGYYLYHGKFPNGNEGALPENDLFTDWLAGDDGFYRLIGAGLVNARSSDQNSCTNLTVEEAITIAESLGYLPTDIKTLDLIPIQPVTADDSPTP